MASKIVARNYDRKVQVNSNVKAKNRDDILVMSNSTGKNIFEKQQKAYFFYVHVFL